MILGKELVFPDHSGASAEGILAFGGDLSPERLVLAYKEGIFPWYNEGEPIIWYSPERRMVLLPENLHISKSMRKFLRNSTLKITWNRAFAEVIEQCRVSVRKGQGGTWITGAMKKAYIQLFELGFAKSVEVWDGKDLVGGLYGIDLGHVFCGESMFSKQANTSKMAFIHLVKTLALEGYALIDCQMYNDHLASMGAFEISRNSFLTILKSGRRSES